MVILKKIKASTLMETLIATVLIMAIFVVSSLILNNLFASTVKHNKRAITAKLNEVEYLYINEQIKLPFQDDYEDWIITVTIQTNSKTVKIKAVNDVSNQVFEKDIFKE